MLESVALIAVRFVASVVLFAVLAKANVWLSPLAATLLVLGYRLGVFLTVPVTRILKTWAATAAFAAAALGTGLWAAGWEGSAVVPLALGMAIGGYLIKVKASQTASGAAWVAVAMNGGSLAAGAVVALVGGNPHIILGGGTAALALCAVLMALSRGSPLASAPAAAEGDVMRPKLAASGRNQLPWALVGAATGILVFSIFSVLPQTLLKSPGHGGQLPDWYGWLMSLNAGLVVLTSVPIARVMQGRSFRAAFAPLALGLALLTLPRVVDVSSFFAAAAWVAAISLCEGALAYSDHLAAKANALLVKDASFGIGASLCVLLSRLCTGETSGLLTGLIGIGCLVVAGGLSASGRVAVLRARPVQ